MRPLDHRPPSRRASLAYYDDCRAPSWPSSPPRKAIREDGRAEHAAFSPAKEASYEALHAVVGDCPARRHHHRQPRHQGSRPSERSTWRAFNGPRRTDQTSSPVQRTVPYGRAHSSLRAEGQSSKRTRCLSRIQLGSWRSMGRPNSLHATTKARRLGRSRAQQMAVDRRVRPLCLPVPQPGRCLTAWPNAAKSSETGACIRRLAPTVTPVYAGGEQSSLCAC
jgi:hypothetical protein